MKRTAADYQREIDELRGQLRALRAEIYPRSYYPEAEPDYCARFPLECPTCGANVGPDPDGGDPDAYSVGVTWKGAAPAYIHETGEAGRPYADPDHYDEGPYCGRCGRLIRPIEGAKP